LRHPFNDLKEEQGQNIHNLKRKVDKHPSVISALSGETSVSQIFESAYFKCARMTIAVGHVVHDVTTSSLQDQITKAIPDLPESCNLCVFVCDTVGSYFQDASVTITGPGKCCKKVRESLCEALESGRTRIRNQTLSLYPKVYWPVVYAVVRTIKDLLIRLRETYLSAP
jgi:hypothetical protein